ncbi:MAG: hypothetical protein QM764_16845 [Chitinophagaceae bacterium]
MRREPLYHISDNPKIKVFEPLPATFYNGLLGQDVVWAISEKMLHNYLLPRNCPRVTFYAGPDTTEADKQKFFGSSTAHYVVVVESKWLVPIQREVLYCYEFPTTDFKSFDECAGYYISHKSVTPIAAKPIYNLMEHMLQRNVELRFMPSIVALGEEVKKSTLQFSLIRMKNIDNETLIGSKLNGLNSRNEKSL